MAKEKVNLTLEEELQIAIIPDSELPYKVPQNWVVCYGKIFGFEKGKKPNNLYKDFQEDRIPYVNIKYFETGTIDQYTNIASTNRICNENDILIVWDGARAGLVGTGVSGAIGSTLSKINFKFLNNKYVYYFFQYYFDDINKNTRGIGIPHVDPDFLASVKFPIPPLAEQNRIVTRIETLFEKLNHAKELVQTALDSFETRRASILHKAFTGELTTKWREDHGMNVDSWEETYSRNIFEYVTSGSRGWSKYYDRTGSIFIRMGNLNHGTIELDMSDIQYVNLPDKVEGKRSKIQKDDILVSITADVGKVGLVRSEYLDAYINQHIALVRPIKTINAEFVAWYLVSDLGLSQLQRLQRGTTKIGLSLEDIKALTIQLPSRLEQDEIVYILDNLVNTEQNAKNSLETVDKIDSMKKAILARAFCGELGTNDPTEENAMELLKSIILEKMNSVPKQKLRAIHTEVNIVALSIMDALEKYNKLTPEQLKKETQLDIDDFYEKIKTFTDSGLIVETRENGNVYLEAVENAN